jgi:5,8-dihydroxy-2-naphthoate synthase
MNRAIKIAYTPDPDDAFHYFALETGVIAPPPGISFQFSHGHIQDLNESSLERTFDVCAISSIHYPRVDRDYVILGSGASVGRGYGPVLGCRSDRDLTELAGRRVAIPGFTTTGYFLLRYFYPDVEVVSMPFNRVAGAIVNGEVDAGVLIHEELLNFAEQPVKKICCLGERWYEHTGLPLPVGLNVARRALGTALITQLEGLIHDSMGHALAEPEAAMKFASRFGRGPASAVREDFVAKFANRDTLLMPPDVREGLKTLFGKALGRRLIDHMPTLDLVDPVLG